MNLRCPVLPPGWGQKGIVPGAARSMIIAGAARGTEEGTIFVEGAGAMAAVGRWRATELKRIRSENFFLPAAVAGVIR